MRELTTDDLLQQQRDRLDRTIAQLAESYRVQLGLRPWEVQAEVSARMLEANRDAYGRVTEPRRSGRTTRGLLLALAKSEVHNILNVVIRGSSRQHERVLCQRMRDLTEQLGLRPRKLRVEPMVGTDHGREQVIYVDHSYEGSWKP